MYIQETCYIQLNKQHGGASLLSYMNIYTNIKHNLYSCYSKVFQYQLYALASSLQRSFIVGSYEFRAQLLFHLAAMDRIESTLVEGAIVANNENRVVLRSESHN